MPINSTLVVRIQMPLPPSVTPVAAVLYMLEAVDEMRALALGGIMSRRAKMRSKRDSSGVRVARSEESEISESSSC